MARTLFIPYPETEAPGAPPDDYQHIQSSPDMFGGLTARATQQAGSQIAQLGTHLTDMYDQIASTDAYTHVQSNINDLMYGNPDKGVEGYLSLKGKAAMDALPGVRAQIDQLIGQTKAGLKTTTAGVDFERNSRRLQAHTLEQAGWHAIDQQKVWGISTMEGNLSSSARATANTYNDDEFALHQREDMRSAAVQRAQLQGKNPIEAIGEADSSWAQARLEGAFARGDYSAAQQINDKFGNLLDPKLRPEIESRISTGLTRIQNQADKATGKQWANSWLGGNLPQTGPAGASGNIPTGGSGTGESHVAPQADRIAFARQYAASKGINPDAVVATMAGEGLGRYTGDNGTSFGDFQLHVGGGMGDQAQAAGINIRDPNTWQDQTKFAIDQMAANRDKGAAWYAGQWHGAPAWAAQSFAQPGEAGGKASAARPAGTTAAGSDGGNIVAFGDSIAAHLIRKAGAGGQESGQVGAYNSGDTAVSGYNPSDVLKVITNTPDTAVQGKNVVLSTGTSNDPQDKWKDSIPAQIALLRSKGAASVTVMGVGTKYADRNQELAQIAQQNGATFSGPLQKPAGDGIHSSDPKAELAAVRSAIPGAADQSPGTAFKKNAPFVKPGITQETSFQTQLTPKEETAFRAWVSDNHVPFNPDAKGPQDYDMRGFYKGLMNGDPHAQTGVNQNDGQLHFNDWWKTPYHQSFSAESQWADPSKAPKWNDKDQLVTPDGRVVFDEKAKAAAADQLVGRPTTPAPTQPTGPAAATIHAPVDREFPDPETGIAAAVAAHERGELSDGAYNTAVSSIQSEYHKWASATAGARAELKRSVTNGIAALADGRDYDYDPKAIRYYFPREQADEYLTGLQDAKDGGQIIQSVRTSSPQDLQRMGAQFAAGLNAPGAPDYARRRKMFQVFEKAVEDHQKNLVGPNADPAAYVATYNPAIGQKLASIDPQNPQSFENYATATLAEQERLGVPVDRQHILPVNSAQQTTMSIAQDAEHAPDMMRALATQYGQHWPQVYGDLVTLGKLPTGYQVVGQLADYDPANAAVLARALGASTKDDKSFTSLVSAKAPGGKSIEDLAKQTIPVDDRIVNYERSLAASGSSPAQIVAIRGAIEHLAAGRAIFLHEAPDEATEKAIDAVVGHYEFMPNGGARVPKNRFGDVSANAGATLNGLSLDNVAVPARYGSAPGEPKPQDYIDMVRAAPTWITGPKADRLMLIDPGGRVVTDKSGQAIAVPFSLGNMTPPPEVPTPGMAPQAMP